jgi:probable phosphoglycerate mutase
MIEKTLYIIRHAQIQSNLDQVYSGRSDESLTAVGVEKAEELGEEIAEWGITTFYVSPLRRTVQTAEILNERVRGRLIEDADLIEMDLGPWTVLSKDAVAGRFPGPYRTWVERPAAFKWDGMETLMDIQQRIVRFLNRFRDAGPDSVAAAVTHAVVVKCACILCNKLHLDSYHAIPAPNLSVHRLTLSDGGCGMVRVR